MIKDYFGKNIEITAEEQRAIQLAQNEAKNIQDDTYPEDGSQDHIDHHIYCSQRECVSALEQELEEKYDTTFLLW